MKDLLFLIFSIVSALSFAHASKAGTLIAGGTETKDYPEVVLLNDGCTATFIQENILITAAHCFQPDDETARLKPRGFTVSVKLNDQKIDQARVYYRSTKTNPYSKLNYDTAIMDAFSKAEMDFDIALITLPSSQHHSFLTLGSAAPETGTPITMVGYGHSYYMKDQWGNVNTDPIGPKRLGKNKVFELRKKAIMIRGRLFVSDLKTFDQNATLPGDSGSPLLNEKKEIVGILSGFSRIGSTKTFRPKYSVPDLKSNEEVSLYQRVDGSEINDWIKNTIEYDQAWARSE